MVVIYEPDARDQTAHYPFDAICPVCQNQILYRLQAMEAVSGKPVHRVCPVCKQEARYKVPDELIQQARTFLENGCPPEILKAAKKWHARTEKQRELMRQKRQGLDNQTTVR
jgi:hypothetical protein